MRYRKSNIESRVQLLRNNGLDVSLDISNGGYQLQNGKQTRTISPRLKAGDFMLWTSAYLDGAMEMLRIKEEAARPRTFDPSRL